MSDVGRISYPLRFGMFLAVDSLYYPMMIFQCSIAEICFYMFSSFSLRFVRFCRYPLRSTTAHKTFTLAIAYTIYDSSLCLWLWMIKFYSNNFFLSFYFTSRNYCTKVFTTWENGMIIWKTVSSKFKLIESKCLCVCTARGARYTEGKMMRNRAKSAPTHTHRAYIYA